MNLFFVCLTFSTAVFTTSAGDPEPNYCSMCKPPDNHTMCLYPDPGPGPDCNKYKSHKMSESDKTLILDMHNNFRSSVAVGSVNNSAGQQPKAANMLQLRWDDELQQLAARWADQCIPFQRHSQHDKCKRTKRFDVGQNIAAFGAPEDLGVDLNRSVRQWFAEQRHFDPRWVSSFAGSPAKIAPKKIGHYTQLVWAKTRYVGCAAVTFEDMVDNKKYIINRVVCDYGPAGNVLGASLYIRGEPCSKCPAKTKCSSQYEGLCVSTFPADGDVKEKCPLDTRNFKLLYPDHKGNETDLVYGIYYDGLSSNSERSPSIFRDNVQYQTYACLCPIDDDDGGDRSRSVPVMPAFVLTLSFSSLCVL